MGVIGDAGGTPPPVCRRLSPLLSETRFLTRVSRAITFLNHTVPDFTDNGASNIIKYGDDYYATSETNYIRKIDPVTLETLDKVAKTTSGGFLFIYRNIFFQAHD